MLIFIVFISQVAFSGTYYVAPDGNDSNLGTLENPFKTISKVHALVTPGDTIYLREGFYSHRSTLTLNKSGSMGNYINLWAYQEETPILDFTEGGISTSARGIKIDGSYWSLRGLVVQNAGDNGIHITGANNIVENVVARYNHDSGFQMHTGASFNLIINCDSYGNYDKGNNGENADGFAAKFSLGEGNMIQGCRAWNNSDDGYDFWKAGNGVTVEDCWAFRNGINVWNDPSFDGDGNGYKLGHGTGEHILIRCVAFDHRAHGIDVNGNETGVTILNCTCYRNGKRNFNFDDSLPHKLRNNLSFDGDFRMEDGIDHQYNSWNGMVVTASDFLSLDTTDVVLSRNNDGILPQIDFLRLASDSPLIDAGIDVGLPYEGNAPDLGAFETTEGTLVFAEMTLQPMHFVLFPNYPNPFNSATIIQYSVKSPVQIKIKVYNTLGQKVKSLIDNYHPAGDFSIVWDGTNELGQTISGGIYYCRMEAGSSSQINKMLFIK